MRPDLESLLDNEREWRRYMIERIEDIRDDIERLKAEALVTRISGGVLLAIAVAWIEWQLNR